MGQSVGQSGQRLQVAEMCMTSEVDLSDGIGLGCSSLRQGKHRHGRY